jgi:single-stranded DNA-binding protein
MKINLFGGTDMLVANGVVRLGGNPDLRFMTNGDPVVSFSGVLDQYKKKNGEEVTVWGRFKAFGDTAKLLHTYLKCGHQLQILEASFSQNKFKNKDGVEVETWDFIVKSFKFMANKKRDSETNETGNNVSQETPDAPVEGGDEIPF